MPAAGCRYDSSLLYAGSFGYYWSGSLGTDYPGRAWCLSFNSDDHNTGNILRYYGLSVRPVLP